MSKHAAKTGSGPTATVAMEQKFPPEERILADPWAARLLSPGMGLFVSLMGLRAVREWMVRSSENAMPGLWGGMLLRKRYIDEKLLAALAETDAVVNLGAGMDSRALRLNLPVDIPVWEVDQAENIAAKQRLLSNLGDAAARRLHLVSMDFEREEIGARLAAAGYLSRGRSFFIWEGVTQYLTEAGICSTLSFLSAAAPGSRLALTYVRRDFLEGRQLYGWERAYSEYVQRKKMWLWGSDPGALAALLAPYGWRLEEDRDAAELAEWLPSQRGLQTSPVERLALAVKE